MTSRSKHGTSRIVPFLPEGCSVDVPAQLVNYICTEFGIVNLRGLNGYERAEALISIAHPDDREMLRKVAKEEGLLPPKSKINFLPEEGGSRRYPAPKERQNYKMPFNSETSASTGIPSGAASNQRNPFNQREPGLRPGLFSCGRRCGSMS